MIARTCPNVVANAAELPNLERKNIAKRIGLREVRALKPGEIVWDTAVPGFGARR